MCSIDSPRLTVKAVPDNVLNKAGPLPLTIVDSTCRINDASETDDRRSADAQWPAGATGPSPVTQRYDLDTPAQCIAPAQLGEHHQCENEVRDLFQGPTGQHRSHCENLDDQDIFDE